MHDLVRIIAVLCCSIATHSLLAQNPFFVHYTTEDGLPSIECYDLIQDKAGFIWIGTDRGLVRFDGTTFKTFTSNDGLPGNVVTTLFPDPDGHIWANCHQRGMVYANGSALDVPEAYKAIPIEYSKIDDFVSFGPDRQFITYSSFLHMDDIAAEIKRDAPPSGIKKEHDDAHEMLIIRSEQSTAFGFSNQPSSDQLLIRDGEMEYTIALERLHSVIHDAVFAQNGQTLYIALKEELLCVENQKIKSIVTMPSSISNSLFVDQENNLWVGTSESGAFMYAGGDLEAEPKRYLGTYHVTSIMEDSQDGIWFSTIQDGIFHMPVVDLNVMNASTGLPENRITYTFHVGNTLWMIYRDGSITSTNLATGNMELVADYRYVFDAFVDNEGRLNIAIDHEVPNPVDSLVYWGPSSYIYYNPETTIVANVGSSILRYFQDGSSETLIPANKIPRTYDIEAFDGQYYFATQSGLYAYTQATDSIFYLGDENPMFRENVSSLARWNDLLLIGMGGTGLFIMDMKKDLVHLTSETALTSNYITNLKVDAQDRLWICTPTGLNMIQLKSIKQGDYSVLNIGKEEGLPVPSVNDVAIIDNTLWAMTDGGAAIIPLQSIQETITPPLYITDFEVNGQSIPFSTNLELNPSENNIQVGFQSIAYKNQAQLKYYYRLRTEKDSAEWHAINLNQLNFANLSPGQYSLEIKSGPAEVPAASKIILDFSIATPLFQRWYVLLIAFLLLLGLGFFFARTRLQQFKRQAALEQQVSTLSYRALRAQMNPHFIYNALNAIQNFIIQQDEKASIAYLSSFSKLIRSIFENSSRDSVSIEEELEAISLYVELESARYPGRFSVDSTIDPEIVKARIAPMIIQPFIENAILHGILPSESEGKISLKMTKVDQHIHVVIEDNGIGINKGRKIGDKKRAYLHANEGQERQSGMSVTKERINEIGVRHRIHPEFKTIDLSNTNPNSYGTCVSFNLPLVQSNSD